MDFTTLRLVDQNFETAENANSELSVTDELNRTNLLGPVGAGQTVLPRDPGHRTALSVWTNSRQPDHEPRDLLRGGKERRYLPCHGLGSLDQPIGRDIQ